MFLSQPLEYLNLRYGYDEMRNIMRLRELREKAGLTMKEVGVAVGSAESTMSLYETGKRQPDFCTMKRIADYFGVTVDYLMGSEVDEILEKRSSEEQTLLRGYRNLSEIDKKEVLEYIEFKGRKKSKKGQ